METIVGIGSAGCNIANQFAQYSQYNIYKIDVGLKYDSFSYNVDEYDTHEEHEKQTPDFQNFFSAINSKVLIITSGAGNISGIALKTIEQLVIQVKPENVDVLYIRPDIEDLNGSIKLQEKLVYNVLQQYARSGMFNNLILVDNPSLEKIVGDVPIRVYFEKLNEVLVSTLHLINIFDHSDAEINSFFKKSDSSRISTLGIYDIEEDEEKLFFPLNKRVERHYYYAINDEALDSDGTLIQNIKRKMREINNLGQRATYAVYPTKYSNNFVYIITFSQNIQKDT
jgi:hypothetical protein